MRKLKISLLFILLSAINIYGAIYKPFTKLYIIKTKKFDIIYPIESMRTAVELSKIADIIYEKHSKLFNATLRGRVTVSITPHVNIFNGFFSPAPYTTIVLYDTPMDGDFTTHRDNLEGLFLHELMHAISLASENNGPQTKVFGNWFTTSLLNNLGFNLEGVTVSYESLDGFGRANDPIIKEFVRQDIIEGAFKKPIQATGVWEHMDGGSVIYNYGGLFSKYLQDKYGMDKYNAWWFKMTRSLYLSLILDNHGIYEAFERVYGIKFSVAWNDFKNYMSIGSVDTNNLRITKRDTIISDVASFGDNVYYLDNDLAILKVYNTKTKKIKSITGIDKSSENISISKDGSKVLISSYLVGSGLYKYIIREYDFKKKRYTKKYNHLRYGDYFKDGIVAVDKNLKNTTLVYVNSKGESELLLPPNNGLSYYYPNVIDDNKIALIVVEYGVKSLRILDYNKKTLTTITTPLQNDSNIWKYMQYLNYANNKLTFAYNDNDKMYKLAAIDINNNKAVFYTNEYSGGVFNAISTAENYYYTAKFSKYYALMEYPNTSTAINTTYTEGSSINISSIENVELSFKNNGYSGEIKNYNPLKYLSPFNSWFAPLPLYNDSYRYFFNGVGILSFISTPSLDNRAILYMGYDIPSKFLQTDLEITSGFLLYPISFKFYDKVVYSYSGGFKYWILGASLSEVFRFDLGSDKAGIFITPVLHFQIFSMFHDINNTASAFTYDYMSYAVKIGTSIKLYYQNTRMNHYDKDLISLKIFPEYSFERKEYYIESELQLQSKYMPVSLRLFASYSPLGVLYDGTGYFSSISARGDETFDYYVREQLYIESFIAGGNLEVYHSFDIDKNLSHLYFNNLYLSLIYSGTYYGFEYMHSIALKASSRINIPIYGAFPSVPVFEPFIKASFMLPNDRNELYKNVNFLDIFYFSYGISISI